MLTSTNVPGRAELARPGDTGHRRDRHLLRGHVRLAVPVRGTGGRGLRLSAEGRQDPGRRRPADRGGGVVRLDGLLPHPGRRRHRESGGTGRRHGPLPAHGHLHRGADGRLHGPHGRRVRRVGSPGHGRPGGRQRATHPQLDRALHHGRRGGEGLLPHGPVVGHARHAHRPGAASPPTRRRGLAMLSPPFGLPPGGAPARPTHGQLGGCSYSPRVPGGWRPGVP